MPKARTWLFAALATLASGLLAYAAIQTDSEDTTAPTVELEPMVGSDATSTDRMAAARSTRESEMFVQ